MLRNSSSNQQMMWRLMAVILLVCAAIGLIGSFILRANAGQSLRQSQGQAVSSALHDLNGSIEYIVDSVTELDNAPELEAFARARSAPEIVTNNLREAALHLFLEWMAVHGNGVSALRYISADGEVLFGVRQTMRGTEVMDNADETVEPVLLEGVLAG